MKLKSFILTSKIHLIRVNTRNNAVCTCERSSALFKVRTRTKHFFKSLKLFTDANSKLETVGALKQITQKASEVLSSGNQFSKIKVFSGLFLKSPVFSTSKLFKRKKILEYIDVEKQFEE